MSVCNPTTVMASSLLRLINHIQHYNTVGRTLDEWSAHCKEFYLAIHNIQVLAGFEATISAGEWPQNRGLDRSATSIGSFLVIECKIQFWEVAGVISLFLNVHACANFFRRVKSKSSIILLSNLRKICSEIWINIWGGKIFPNRQLGMAKYVTLIMIMVLEWLNMPH